MSVDRIPKQQAVKANTGSGCKAPYRPKTDLRNRRNLSHYLYSNVT
jgi:hypothetical protein